MTAVFVAIASCATAGVAVAATLASYAQRKWRVRAVEA
ncbi:hypothetical protein A4R44_06133 [Amycolatopsis sp. M39]|uniref:Uncharacterized protein n=1 Tax=Amycolatopsis rubida TaxID=112413 RepID=A0A1I5CZ60_9PSEU|nr:hypothetical protein A4R44_06133 [Amycolatopsis sp. M39]SFN92167.1 hypothetical protein SAMN05421854_10137 [Amycolatopsis rubida]